MSDPSASIENSRRILNKVTYTPLVLPESADGGGALQVIVAAEQFRLLAGEAQTAMAAGQISEQIRAALAGFDDLANATVGKARLEAAVRLARMATSILTDAVSLVRAGREKALAETINLLGSLARAYVVAARSRAAEEANNSGIVGSGTRLQARRYQLDEVAGDQGPWNKPAGRPMIQAGELLHGSFRLANGNPRLQLHHDPALVRGANNNSGAELQLPEVVADRLGAELSSQALTAVGWAERNATELLAPILTAPAAHVPVSLRQTGTDLLLHGLPFLVGQVQRTAAVVGHLAQRNLQPIGLLHLEQLVVTPLNIERGELLYSLPLSPGEKVTLSHKEWTLREEEYTRFVQDYLENYSERGVAEKSDMAVSARSETEHTKTLSMTSRPVLARRRSPMRSTQKKPRKM